MVFITKIIRTIGLIPIVLSGLIVVLMMVHICVDVIGKYLFNAPVPGTITLVTQYYMPILTFLPLAYVQQMRQHISVEVLTSRLSLEAQYHLYHIILLFSAGVFGLLAVTTYHEALRKFAQDTFIIEQGIRIINWPGYFFLPIGYGLVAALMAFQFVEYLLGRAPRDVS